MSSMKPAEWGMLILLSIIWGGSFFFTEIALRDFQPFTVVFLRVTLAALILIGVVYISGQRMPASLRTWGAFVVMGALNNAIPFSLVTDLTHSPNRFSASNSSFFLYCYRLLCIPTFDSTQNRVILELYQHRLR